MNKDAKSMKTADPKLLQDIVARVTAAVHPSRIILFGSAARGELGRNSDLDILVIMPEEIHRRRTAQTVFRALRGIGTPKDIVVVTERDVVDYGENPSFVLKPALAEGRLLYAAG